MENRSKFDDFLSSLETDQLKDGQDALLLTGEIENQYGGNNTYCNNQAEACDGTTNSKCTNLNSTGCIGSKNAGTRKDECASTQFKKPNPCL